MRNHFVGRIGDAAKAAGMLALAVVCATAVLACTSVLGVGDFQADGNCPETNAKRCAGPDNNTPQTCNAQGHWENAAEPCADQTCLDGTCVDCVPGSKRCAGLTREVCDPTGEWKQLKPPCDQDAGLHCSGGACVVDCVPGDFQCSGDQPQLCDAGGNWQNDGPACDACKGCDVETAKCASATKPDGAQCQGACPLSATCKSGVCVCKTQCDEGDKQCMGNIPQMCDAQGLWQGSVPCVGTTCVEGECKGECESGGAQCNGNTPQACEQGQWQDVSSGPCVDKTCVGGTCKGECAVGAKRCTGVTPEECDETGHWKAGAPCDPEAGKYCSGGVCVVACIPGDSQCLDLQPQFCNLDGIWENKGEVCNPCFGCDSNTAACASEKKPDGTPCTLLDKCVLSAACQVGTCTSSTAVECAPADACGVGTCNPNTGFCLAKADGVGCDDGDACTMSSGCNNGICSSPNNDRAWAHWDLNATPPSPRYATTSLVVYDKLTRLMWQRKASVSGYNWDDAKDYCACLGGASNNVTCEGEKIPGYPSGWRLPTRIELVSIVHYSAFDPAIDASAFPNTPLKLFWSSSAVAGDPPSPWVVWFHDGSVGVASPSVTTNRVRCVR